ncbi:hypothetical protein SpCBS45565_g01075 [Spizellomyces sp. 'palustris']|nr:hypothetical protein SpCBS45565_g01075 [Spizellomyces sp. 'palustris']
MSVMIAGLPSIVVASSIVFLLAFATMVFRNKDKNSFEPKDKHVYITGGSQGTGLALAKVLAKRGAHVTIVARSVDKLKAAQLEISACKSSEEQVIRYESADLCVPDLAANAMERAEQETKKKVDYVFMCAGSARPGFFASASAADLEKEMQTDYFTAAYTAHAAVQSFLTHSSPASCRLVFVSSVCGLMGLPGYAAYCGAKFAVRGLAEALRMELLMYGIKVHIYFPGTIYSPGLEEENKTKPQLTKDIEGADEGVTPAKAAAILMRGIEKEHYSISSDFTGDLIRSMTKGAPPANNAFVDGLYSCIAWIAMPIWRIGADAKAVNEGKRLKKAN